VIAAMFTGLVEALGEVTAVVDEGPGRRLGLRHSMAAELEVGESVAVNGVCLTVVEVCTPCFSFQAGPETLARTNLGVLRPGDFVNLERSLRLGDRLGGHWVQGHVDGVGSLAKRIPHGEWDMVWFACPVQLARQLVSKGSVAVDGVSLTVVDVEDDRFSVALIPHTLNCTTLGRRKVGELVNLETDILGKYVLRYLSLEPRLVSVSALAGLEASGTA